MADIPNSAKSVTASLWLERAEKYNPILPTPGSPMAAAVAEEMEEYADRKLADFLATRAAPPAMDREAVEIAVRGISDDFMTSETHHPGYVLIPLAKCVQLQGAEASLVALDVITANTGGAA